MLSKYKPGASVRTHLLVTAMVWSLVGLMLMVRAGVWIYKAGVWWILPIAILTGGVKSYYILDRVARRNVERTVGLAEGTCIGAAYSWKTWLLILFMILLGRFIRQAGLSLPLIGFLYLAIGWALLWSSRVIWQHWRKW